MCPSEACKCSRCKVDGTDCAHAILPSSTGFPVYRGVLTPTGPWLSARAHSGTTVLQCGLDPTTCERSNLAANGALHTEAQAIIFDATANRVLVAGVDSNGPVIFRRPLDGSPPDACVITSSAISNCH